MYFIFTAELKPRRINPIGQLSWKRVGGTPVKGYHGLSVAWSSYSHTHKTSDDLLDTFKQGRAVKQDHKSETLKSKLPAVHVPNLFLAAERNLLLA